MMKNKLFVAVWSLDATDTYFLNAMSSVASCMEYHGDSILYAIATSKTLSPVQQAALKRVMACYKLPIRVIPMPNLKILKPYSPTWPPIVFAKILLGRHFPIPYAAFDADVMFLGQISDVSFLNEKPIMSIPDTDQLRLGRLEKLEADFGYKIPVCLSGGSLFIAPNTLFPEDVIDFVCKYGHYKSIVHPEQESLIAMCPDKCGYLPDGMGTILYTRKNQEWETKRNDILAGKYKFVHLVQKQWQPESLLHDQYLLSMKKLGFMK